jgi:hypothetical protein
MTMIDHPGQVERLMERLGTALPIPARLIPEVQMTEHRQACTSERTNSPAAQGSPGHAGCHTTH